MFVCTQKPVQGHRRDSQGKQSSDAKFIWDLDSGRLLGEGLGSSGRVVD